MAKKLSQTMQKEFDDLVDTIEDWMMHTEIVKDEVSGGAARKHMSSSWSNMDKALDLFKARAKLFIKAQSQFNESALTESKSLKLVKQGKVKKLDDDQLADVAGEIENKKWNKDNKAEVDRWVKDVNAELKKRGMLTGESKVKATFESAGERKKSFKQFFEAKMTKIVTDKSEIDEHWHEGTVDDEGDGKTTKTLPKGHPVHIHKIVGGGVETSKRHDHAIKA